MPSSFISGRRCRSHRLAVSTCVKSGLGSPTSYGEAFSKLAGAGLREAGLSERLSCAAGFRNLVAHAYENLDMGRVHRLAVQGPADLRAFLAAMATLEAARTYLGRTATMTASARVM